jgi:hypothetical protein
VVAGSVPNSSPKLHYSRNNDEELVRKKRRKREIGKGSRGKGLPVGTAMPSSVGARIRVEFKCGGVFEGHMSTAVITTVAPLLSANLIIISIVICHV